jgi:hypothetical protein
MVWWFENKFEREREREMGGREERVIERKDVFPRFGEIGLFFCLCEGGSVTRW